MPVSTLTFGCRLNTAESRMMEASAAEAGVRDALLVNTCAVTSEAVRQARQAIRRARRNRPHRPVIVSGCAAQIDPAAFAGMPEVDRVLGNAEKLVSQSYGGPLRRGAGSAASVRVGDIMTAAHVARHDGTHPASDRTRAFVQVQNGCDHRCTFCVIPFGRGNSRSLPLATVVDDVRRLSELGYPEVVLTGVDITAWGADLGPGIRLGTLVRAVLRAVPALPRLRLSSLDPIEADAELMQAIAEEDRLMPHLHLSLQSGDDMILKRMKRRHTRADAIRFCDGARRLRPDLVFSADLIAGFPTETEEMFANSLSLVEEAGLSSLHVFPFSPRSGTPAARMPQVPGDHIRERAARLRARGERAQAAYLAREVGCRRSVLVERSGLGRTEHFAPVAMHSSQAGRVIACRIVSAGPSRLTAEPLADAA